MFRYDKPTTTEDNAPPARKNPLVEINSCSSFCGGHDSIYKMKALIILILIRSLTPVNADVSAFWRFEGGAADSPATTLADSSGNANTGTPTGGPIHRTSTPPRYPGLCSSLSLEFDGIDDIVEIPDSASLDFSASFTIEFWMRSPGTGAGQDLIIDKSHGTDGSTGWFFQSRPGVGIVDFGMGNGATFPLVSSTSDLFDDEWHHLAGTYDGNTIEFFVDGVSQGTIVAGTYSDNASPVRMGNTASISRYFKGHLDEVRISDAVLLPSDFLFVPPSPTTIAYWRFEEGTADSPATTLLDLSGNANTGTPSGGPIHRASTPPGFPGICNSLSLEFDGIDDIVEIPDSASLDFSGSFTVEFWMRSPGTGAGQDLIIDKSHGFTSGLTGWVFQSKPGVGIVDFGMGNGTTFPVVSSNSDLFDDEWHHLAGTYDGNTIEFFVDGVSQGTTVIGTYSDNSNPVRMGNTVLSSRYFKGHLDEVRISNAALKAPDFLQGILAGALKGSPSTTSVAMDTTEHFGLQFRRLSGGATDGENVYTTDRYIYTIELSDGLGVWGSAGTEIRYTTPIYHGDGTETVTAYLFAPFPISGVKFMRLHVTLQSP